MIQVWRFLERNTCLIDQFCSAAFVTVCNASQALFPVLSSLVGGRLYSVKDQVCVAVAACWAQAPHQAIDPSPLPVANRLLLFA